MLFFILCRILNVQGEFPSVIEVVFILTGGTDLFFEILFFWSVMRMPLTLVSEN